MKFTVFNWDDVDNSDPHIVDAQDVRHAAEIYCERCDEDNNGMPEEDVSELVVMGPDGRQWEVTVDRDTSITYSSSATLVPEGKEAGE